MRSAIVVHPRFDTVWPFAADHALRLWQGHHPVEFFRLGPEENRSIGDLLSAPDQVVRLIVFGLPIKREDFAGMTRLREVAMVSDYPGMPIASECVLALLEERGVRLIRHASEGFWGQSVAEFALGLTLAALRRIPQTHRSIITSLDEWSYNPPDHTGGQRVRGIQFGDDINFTHGTLEGKRVRIVGAGNIASRYASFAHFLGADVAAFDPFASEPCFHRSGARREFFLDRLVADAEIFAPMVPLTEKSQGLVTAKHLENLPRGALVILVTRANIVDMPALRRRVLNNELALAADVFDVEPLSLDDPLLGRPNVIHTPHNAGRTRQANESFATAIVEQFTPIGVG